MLLCIGRGANGRGGGGGATTNKSLRFIIYKLENPSKIETFRCREILTFADFVMQLKHFHFQLGRFCAKW